MSTPYRDEREAEIAELIAHHEQLHRETVAENRRLGRSLRYTRWLLRRILPSTFLGMLVPGAVLFMAAIGFVVSSYTTGDVVVKTIHKVIVKHQCNAVYERGWSGTTYLRGMQRVPKEVQCPYSSALAEAWGFDDKKCCWYPNDPQISKQTCEELCWDGTDYTWCYCMNRNFNFWSHPPIEYETKAENWLYTPINVEDYFELVSAKTTGDLMYSTGSTATQWTNNLYMDTGTNHTVYSGTSDTIITNSKWFQCAH